MAALHLTNLTGNTGNSNSERETREDKFQLWARGSIRAPWLDAPPPKKGQEMDRTPITNPGTSQVAMKVGGGGKGCTRCQRGGRGLEGEGDTWGQDGGLPNANQD